jgi:ABC-type glycerol-3-phosphate transport system permease component
MLSSNTKMMRKITTLLFLLLLVGVTITMCEDEEKSEESSSSSSSKLFLMENFKSVVKTDAGEMRLFKNNDDKFLDRSMHIGLINMEPRSLFIPQYLDSNLIIFVRRGIIILLLSFYAYTLFQFDMVVNEE